MSVRNPTELTPQAPPVQRRLGLALLVIATAELMLVLDSNAHCVRRPDLHR